MLITQLVIITRCSTRCPREERTWVLVKDSWSAWPGRSSGRPRWEQRWKQPSEVVELFPRSQIFFFCAPSGFCLGASVRRGNCSCWPWDRWPDPVDYKGRVPRMVCRLIIDHLRCHRRKKLVCEVEYLFSLEVLPSETYFSPPAQSSPSPTGWTQCWTTTESWCWRREPSQNWTRPGRLSLSAKSDLDYFRNLLKVEGGIFKGMCQDAGVGLG